MENQNQPNNNIGRPILLGIIIIATLIAVAGIVSVADNLGLINGPASQVASWTQNIPQSVKDKLTSEELNQFIDITKKTTPDFRQTFVSDYAKQMARENRLMVFSVWAKSLGLGVNYQLDDVWEISDRIKTKTNNFALYRDEVKFMEFIATVTDKQQGGVELQKFLESF